MKIRTSLKGLDVTTIMHPKDITTIKTLGKIPGFKMIVDKTVGNIMEKYAAIEYSAEGINVTSRSLPNIHHQLIEACRILDIKDIPKCSTDWYYDICSFSVGEHNKRMILQSGTIDLLTSNELNFVMGHELGHMKCGHKTYHMFTEALYMPIANSDLKIWMGLVKMPLLNWYRISDFTADRMGLLCCQDINVALGTMIKMAGLPKKYYSQIHIESFIKQAVEFEKTYTSTMENIIKYLSINAASMPWLIVRAGELWKWYNSGEYLNVVNKSKIKF